jgi:hypothetical protein
MDQNEAAPLMEKLEYKEFVIDYELKEKLEAEGAKMVVLLQARHTIVPSMIPQCSLNVP